MTKCHAQCEHRRFVRGYQEERERQEIAAENDWRNRDGNDEAAPLITFKDWLVAGRGRGGSSADEPGRMGEVGSTANS